MTFDIRKPHVVKLSRSLEGQQILVYGTNSTGKSYNGSLLKKPLFLPFEEGIRTLDGVNFFPIKSWGDFLRIVRNLTKPSTLDEIKELYSTIVIDEVYTAAKYLDAFICAKYGVETVGEGNGGYGLWSQVENEWFSAMDKLMKAGFSLYFIGHEARDKDTNQLVPKGDKRTMQFIRDNCDIVAYLKSNGIDEEGKVIPSSAYFAETPEYFARSRFTQIVPYIKEFSADNLEKAVIDAIEKQEKLKGIKAVSHEEHRTSFENRELDFDSILEEVNSLGVKLAEGGFLDELLELVEKHLGANKKVADAKPSDVEFLSLLLMDIEDFMEDNKISV